MKSINQLKLGAILSYVSLALTSVISLIYTPIMLNQLGQSEYGLYTLSNSVIGYLGILDFGLSNAVVRYTTKYKTLKDKENEENLYGMFIIIYSILAVIIVIAGSIIILNLDTLFSKSLTLIELNKMKIIMGILIFNLAISFPFGVFNGIILAYEHFVFPKLIAIIRAILNPLIMLPLLFMGYRSIAMTIATTILNIMFIIINIYYCFKILKIKVKFNIFRFDILKEISSYSFFIFLNIIIDKIYWSTDQLILGAVSGTVAVAIYSIGSTFISYYMSFSTAISSVFLPRVTQMVTKKVSSEEISELFIRTGRVQYIVMSYILSSFILFGKSFISIWAGNGYRESFYIALIVMCALTIPLIQNIGITILQAKNLHRFRSKIYIVIALLNLIVSIPLAKLFGGIGAAACTATAMILGNGIIINLYYYRKIKINIPKFWGEIATMTIPVVISMFCGFLINKLISINGYMGIAIKGTIFSIIFVFIMFKYGVNEYEEQLFLNPIKKIKNKITSRENLV